MKRTHSLGRPNTSSNRFRATEKATEIVCSRPPEDGSWSQAREVRILVSSGEGTVVKIEMVMVVIIPNNNWNQVPLVGQKTVLLLRRRARR